MEINTPIEDFKKIKTYSSIINTFCFFLFGPILTISFILCFIYRFIISIVLKLQYKNEFYGLLEGTDTVWAVEDSSALSVVTIVALIELKYENSQQNQLFAFKKQIESRLIFSDFEKLHLVRGKKYGYYFWNKCNKVDMRDRIKWLNHNNLTCDGCCIDIQSSSFKKNLENICNQPLPKNHTVPWEILIGRPCSEYKLSYFSCIKDLAPQKKDRKKVIKIPIVCRIHHSLSDGVALINLLLETIADKKAEPTICLKRCKEFQIDLGMECNEFSSDSDPENYHKKSLEKLEIPSLNIAKLYGNNILGASMPYLNFYDLKIGKRMLLRYFDESLKLLQSCSVNKLEVMLEDFVQQKYCSLKKLFENVISRKMKKFMWTTRIFFSIPMCWIAQSLHSMDNSAIHGPVLTGKKLIAYWIEDYSSNILSPCLTTKIREIKMLVGSRFEDIVLTAISVSIHKYFLQIKEAAPEKVTVVLPTRIEASDEKLKLCNRFSVGLLPLCISQIDGRGFGDPNQDAHTFQRLRYISMSNNNLKMGPNYVINYWVMKYLCAILPEGALRPLLKSYSTMVLTNLPGPPEVKILDSTVKNLFFCSPNRGTTGLTCSVFSYAGKLHLSLVADTAVIPSDKLLSQILNDTVREIENIYDTLTSSIFSKKFFRPAATTKNESVCCINFNNTFTATSTERKNTN